MSNTITVTNHSTVLPTVTESEEGTTESSKEEGTTEGEESEGTTLEGNMCAITKTPLFSNINLILAGGCGINKKFIFKLRELQKRRRKNLLRSHHRVVVSAEAQSRVSSSGV